MHAINNSVMIVVVVLWCYWCGTSSGNTSSNAAIAVLLLCYTTTQYVWLWVKYDTSIRCVVLAKCSMSAGTEWVWSALNFLGICRPADPNALILDILFFIQIVIITMQESVLNDALSATILALMCIIYWILNYCIVQSCCSCIITEM